MTNQITPQDSSATKNKRYSSVTNMEREYPELGWTESTYRWLIFNRNSNGFSECVRKVGSRIVIDLDEFEAWMESHKQEGTRG